MHTTCLNRRGPQQYIINDRPTGDIAWRHVLMQKTIALNMQTTDKLFWLLYRTLLIVWITASFFHQSSFSTFIRWVRNMRQNISLRVYGEVFMPPPNVVWPEAYCFCSVRPCVHPCVPKHCCRVFNTFSPNLQHRCAMGQRRRLHNLGQYVFNAVVEFIRAYLWLPSEGICDLKVLSALNITQLVHVHNMIS